MFCGSLLLQAPSYSYHSYQMVYEGNNIEDLMLPLKTELRNCVRGQWLKSKIVAPYFVVYAKKTLDI
ncbi:hypothetical protein QJS10_CPA16g01077 [Acorus calamus]|uniref:Uncharacterized protein n=1 Tax=Acorus calamus TaxID=4465 RepID=A0AAV9D1L1_ACOCL|nr:hypothetical protein QJS10_CPA16g01077 [Acorus calamus]